MLKTFVWLHRWLGIFLCLLFAVWFASGAVLVFVPFPSLDAQKIVERAEPVPLAPLRISPRSALLAVHDARDLRLIGVLGEPVYVVASGAGDRAISGVSGLLKQPLTAAEAERVAAAFGGAPAKSASRPIEYDQWIVHQGFDHARPLYRVALADRAGTELYVSARTGQVVQMTRRNERAWNWAGAVVHWLYFVPLRKTFSIWDQTVWWVALVGTFMTVAGVGLGVYRTVKKMRSGRPGFTPFKGWLKWHHILGITASLFVFTYILSGWLSMDHGRLFSRGAAPEQRSKAYMGLPLVEAAGQVTVDKLRSLGPATSIDFNVVQGRLIASVAGPGASGRVMVAGASPAIHVPPDLLTAALHQGWPESVVRGPTTAPPGDFYAKAESAAPGVQIYRLSGGTSARAYVDPISGRIIAFVDRSRVAYDWVYYGLHTFNFPGLLSHPLLRDLIVLPLLALGFALCVTSVVVGVRRLRIVADH